MEEDYKSEVVMLREVSQTQSNGKISMNNEYRPTITVGKNIRTQGQCITLHNATMFCEIEHDGSSLWVDLSLVGSGSVQIEGLCQFIGELKDGGTLQTFPFAKRPPLYLEAKIVRNIDGLDMRLFEEALIQRRKFLTKS